MKALLSLAALFCALSTPAFAAKKSYSCEQLQDRARKIGYIEMYVEDRNYIERYYAAPGYCARFEKEAVAAVPEYFRTADKRACLVGYACVDEDGVNVYRQDANRCKEGQIVSFRRKKGNSWTPNWHQCQGGIWVKIWGDN